MNKGLEVLKEPSNQDLIKYIFLDYHNQPSLFREIAPEEYKEYKKSLSKIKKRSTNEKKKRTTYIKRANNNRISNLFKALKNASYFYTKINKLKRKSAKGKPYPYPIKKYKLNSKFFFDYAKEILKENDFIKDEKKLIYLIVEKPEIRKIILSYPDEMIIDKFKSFLLDFFVLNYDKLTLSSICEFADNNNKFEFGDKKMRKLESQMKLFDGIRKKVKKIYGFNNQFENLLKS